MNVANQISEVAAKHPHKRSVVCTSGKDAYGNYRYVHYTFSELEEKINRFARALRENGVEKGDKTLLFVRPCLDFSALTFALFKIGAVPVFIDPGMGRKPFLRAIKDCSPKILIGIPKVFILKVLFRKWFKSVRTQFVYSPRSFLGVRSIVKAAAKAHDSMNSMLQSEPMSENDLAAILFTSGGTGKPKGVVYTHDIFINQTKALQKEFGLTSEDVDVPGFPLFALFTLSMGMTSVIPDMDPSSPSKADPQALYRVIMEQGGTFAAGSPAIWRNLAEYCDKNKLQIPSLKHLVMFGAPIPLDLHELFQKALPNGDTHTPYGATESLPVSNAKGKTILNEKRKFVENGAGVYVGLPLEAVKVRVIEAVSGSIESIDDTKELGRNEIGEILVSSPTTTKSYYQLEDKTKEAKVLGDNCVWHRMGDMGYLDEDGALWFCGRKAHVVDHVDRRFYPVPVEAIFNKHPLVSKSALISKNGRAAIAIERVDGKESLSVKEAAEFRRELMELGAGFEQTKDFEVFFLCGKFPVDIRHNIKIDRQKLGQIVGRSLENV